jgi:AcrR family transcriptional regulator
MSEDDTRHRILNAAGEAFAERGLQKTTVREICESAGVNLAAVNYHFHGKENLYREVIRYAHSAKVTQFPMPPMTESMSAEERLHGFVMTMARRMLGTAEMNWQNSLLFREMFSPTGVCRELVLDFIRPHHDMLLSILKDLAPENTPQMELYQVAWSVVGQVHFYKVHRPVTEMLVSEEMLEELFTPEIIADHVTRFTIAALSGEHFLNASVDPSASAIEE